MSAEQGPRQGGDATATNGLASQQRDVEIITHWMEART
jgi:hypothetical protein